jgi:hypothetical protein
MRPPTRSNDRTAEVFQIKKAVRHRTPQILCIYGIQFSGKTFGAFCIASGLMKPGGKLGFIDTENGRGSQYADDPDIIRMFPQGFDIIELDPPFHPARYIDAIAQFQSNGYDMVIVDSGSHAWEGEGGAQDMKEEDKEWTDAKKWSKRLKFAIVYSSMDIIVCLRAQEKTKVSKVGGKTVYSPLGILPICEKSLPFDVGFSIYVEGEVEGRPSTHLATPMKFPKALNWLIRDWRPQLLTPELGRKIREWNEGGAAMDEVAILHKQAGHAALQGMAAYEQFCKSLDAGRRKFLLSTPEHVKNKQAASQADAERDRRESGDQDVSPLQDRLLAAQSSPKFRGVLGACGYEDWAEVPVEKRAAVLAEVEQELSTEPATT